MRMYAYVLIAISLVWLPTAYSSDAIPLEKHNDDRYYTTVTINDSTEITFLVDSGATNSSIDVALYEKLTQHHAIQVVSEVDVLLMGVAIAKNVKVVNLKKLMLANGCVMHDIHTVVVGNVGLNILGLYALEQLGSVNLNFNPPTLQVNECPR